MDDERLRAHVGSIIARLLAGPPLMYGVLLRSQLEASRRDIRLDRRPCGMDANLPVVVEISFASTPSLKEYLVTAIDVRYRLRLRRDWHLRVHQQGIAVVEECLILDALKASQEMTPAGAECWQCQVLAPFGERTQGLLESVEYVVRYGGLCRRGHAPHETFDRLLKD